MKTNPEVTRVKNILKANKGEMALTDLTQRFTDANGVTFEPNPILAAYDLGVVTFEGEAEATLVVLIN